MNSVLKIDDLALGATSGASAVLDMPGEDSERRRRGRIERRGDTFRVRVYADNDPVTGKRVYREDVTTTDTIPALSA